jgi:hypothetical protein
LDGQETRRVTVVRFGDDGRTPEDPALLDLAALFGFTPHELALNRIGYLSPQQRQRLFYRSVGYLVNGLGVVLLNAILLSAVAPRVQRPWQRAILVALWVGLGVFAVLVIVSAWRVFSPRVKSATGSIRRGGTPRKPRVEVGGVELRLSFRRWKRLPPSFPGRYTVYYAGFVGDLLSLEPAA